MHCLSDDYLLPFVSEKRFGKNRSLMSEVYESIALCYRRLGEDENAKLFCLKSVSTRFD